MTSLVLGDLILESLTPSVNAPLSLLNAIRLQFYPVILSRFYEMNISIFFWLENLGFFSSVNSLNLTKVLKKVTKF
jgi:hypothetical protein